MTKGLSGVKTLTAREIAKKWNLPLSVVAKKIADGVKVEKEHTTSTRQAGEIARDHLGERPDYYDKLHKMEKTKIVKEEIGTGGIRGLGFVTGDPGVNYVDQYINTNSMSYDDQNGNNFQWIKKQHLNLHNNALGFEFFNPTQLKENLLNELGDYVKDGMPGYEGTSTPRSIRKNDSLDEGEKIKKAKKLAAAGLTAANLYTIGDVAGRAGEGRGSPKGDIVRAATTLPGAAGWAATGVHYAKKAYDKVKAMKEDKDPCWKGYEMVGMKKKGAKNVPNCVPVKEQGPVMSRYNERPTYEENKYPETAERGIYETIKSSTSHKVVHRDSKKIIAQGTKKEMMKRMKALNAKNPGSHFLGNAPSKKVGDIFSEDWQSVNRKDKTDGLSQKAVNAYKRENPGSKLQTAVTEKNPTGKRASRRKSFCSRMGGMKKRLTSAKTARDPDSRINKALRRWNCEESVMNEVSAQLVGKVHNRYLEKGKAPPAFVQKAVKKKWLESQVGKIKDKKQIKEVVATAVPPVPASYQAAGQQQMKTVQPGQTKINIRDISPTSRTSGTGTARLSQGGSTSGYNTLKPTTTDVRRNISNRFNANMSQQATGSMRPSSVTGSSSMATNSQSRGFNVGKTMGDKLDTVSRNMPKGFVPSSIAKAAPTAAKIAGAAVRAATGPAATVAATVMSPTPAGAGENEKARQDTLKNYNPYKAQGRSISDYEKQVLTPKTSETPKAEPKMVNAPTPPSRPDYFSRGQAFNAARGEAGGGEGKFSYQSGSDSAPKEYQTNVKSEPYKPSSQLKQTSIKEETKMDTKELINEAITNIAEENLHEMKDNFIAVLNEKAMEKLEERKKEIASQYFAQ